MTNLADTSPEAGSHESPSGSVSRGLVLVLARPCGLAVANLYYAQPLLHELAVAFGASPAGAGLVVTVTQAGYAVGLLFLVPLGNLLERRSLVVMVLGAAAASLVGSALAGSLAVFEAAALAVGCTSVVAQVLVPMAAEGRACTTASSPRSEGDQPARRAPARRRAASPPRGHPDRAVPAGRHRAARSVNR